MLHCLQPESRVYKCKKEDEGKSGLRWEGGVDKNIKTNCSKPGKALNIDFLIRANPFQEREQNLVISFFATYHIHQVCVSIARQPDNPPFTHRRRFYYDQNVADRNKSQEKRSGVFISAVVSSWSESSTLSPRLFWTCSKQA